MCRSLISPFLYMVVALAGLVATPRAAFAADGYDVSYLWSHDIAGVRDYRERVASVLGPAVAKDLKVVASGELFGLVYLRQGDSAGASRVARSHTRLLRSRGLEAASPVRARDWRLVGSGEARRVSIASLDTPKVSRSKMTTRERSREIHNLEVAVENYIDGLRREGKIAPDERTGWSVYDFTTGEKLVTINEDEQFQAASLVKPFIAAAFFHKVAQGELIYGPDSRRHMELMIQRSDNAAANWAIRQVGGPQAVERILKRSYPGIFQEIHLVEYIPADGRTYRNKASVHDYSRFLYAVWKDDIAGAREIKRLMALPGSDRIYTGVSEVPKGTRVYDKTGSTARVCGDMGILSVRGADGRRYPYTLVGIIEKQQSAPNYTAWIRSRSDVIRNVSAIVYKGIAQHHDI
ncbi:MAG: class A beta-lactamase-related serine hydrolase [Thiogranum sp.]|nr:class A beta-lactamase-related serine hydrolase [Thiogranum sp.]